MAMNIMLDFNLPLPLFPLPSCVLLPHATIPLHIFEPRYRQMTADALAGNRMISMAMFDGPAWKQDYHATPPLRDHVCVGYIVRHEDLPDGRYNILLQGLCRAKIELEEVDEPLLYRRAYLQPTEIPSNEESQDIELQAQRQIMLNLLHDPLLKQLTAVNSIHQWLNDEIHTQALIDLGMMTLCEESEPRYAMLKESNVLMRARMFIDLLSATRRTMKLANRFAPPELLDHMHMN